MRHHGGRGCERVGSDVMRRDGNIPEVRDSACGRRVHQGWLNTGTTEKHLTSFSSSIPPCSRVR